MATNANPEHEFYIGWQEEAPDAYAKKARNFTYLLLFLVPLVAAIFVIGQQGFENSVFEFGKITTREGILVTKPIPMLKIAKANGYESILLVGFGKMGAEKDLEKYEKGNANSINGKTVKLAGTLIYHHGKKALELTEGTAAILEVKDGTPLSTKVINHGKVKLRGEIYDPKCALGVMKPGYGKPHRSCAIRCISGGIPPVLRMTDQNGNSNYVLLLDQKGKPINDAVLDYVADQIQICGRLEQQDDWLILFTNPEKDIFRLQPYWMDGKAPMCSN